MDSLHDDVVLRETARLLDQLEEGLGEARSPEEIQAVFDEFFQESMVVILHLRGIDRGPGDAVHDTCLERFWHGTRLADAARKELLAVLASNAH